MLGLASCAGAPQPSDSADSADSSATGDTGPPPIPFYGLAFTLVQAPLGPGNRDTWSQALSDVNGDGNLDIFAGNHAGFPQLWLGDGGGTFELSTTSLTATPARDDHGLVLADLDADGDRDAYMVTGRGQTDDQTNRLWLNESGALSAADAGPLAQMGGRGRTPLVYDFDGNGQLDIFTRHEPRPDGDEPSTLFLNGPTGFTASPADFSEVALGFDALVDADADGDLDWLRWGSVPELVQLPSLEAQPVPSLDMPRVFGAHAFDADNDGTDELLIVRGYGLLVPELRQPTPDELWAGFGVDDDVRGFDVTGGNQLIIEGYSSRIDPAFAIGGQDPVFFELPQLALARDSVPEGLPAPDDRALIWIGRTGDTWHFRFRDPSAFIRAAVHITASDPLTNITEVGTPTVAEPPLTQLMRHDGTEWVPMPSGPTPDPRCDDAAPADFDNDGDIDVFFACSAPTRNLPDELWLNDGAGSYTVSEVDVTGRTDIGRSTRALTGDIDNDGAIDIFVAAGQPDVPDGFAPYWLLHNQGNDHHWLIVDARGAGGNREALGARVEIDIAGQTRHRWVTAGQSDGSQHDRRVHFGLGLVDQVDELRVYWPSGTVTTRTSVSIDEVVVIQQPL